MQPSVQAMGQFAAPSAAKSEAKLPLLSLLTFSPIGNPLSSLTPGQCNLFFDYLLMSLHNQRKEQLERIAALNKKIVLPASISAAAMGARRLSQGQKARHMRIEAEMNEAREKMAREAGIASGKAKGEENATGKGAGDGTTGVPGAEGMAGWKFSSLFKKRDGDKKGDGGSGGAAGGRVSLLSIKHDEEKRAQEGKIAGRKAKWEENSASESKDGGTTGTLGAEGMVGWRARQLSAKHDEDRQAQEDKLTAENSKEEGDAAVGGKGGASGVAGWKFSSLFKKRSGKKLGGGEGSAGSGLGQKNAYSAASMEAFNSTFGKKSGEVSGTIEQLVVVIDDYARGDAEKERKVVRDWQESLRAANYKADDMMASLLIVIEDNAWSGEEGGLGTSKPPAGATLLATMVPKKLRSAAQESLVMRLASVREMLRYYFDMHPQDYQAALAAALGLSPDDEEDAYALQERLAYELASIGSFALAQKILAELKSQKNLGTKECLMKLGYRYDVKRKRLVIGKRTCGKPAEARGIIGLLLASARKKPKN